jgi:cyanophycinase-like exopeptidase
MLRSAFIFILTTLIAFTAPVAAQQNGFKPALILFGGGYSNAYSEITSAAIAHSGREDINILILPTTLASDPDDIPETEREQILDTAEFHRQLFQESCENLAPNPYRCRTLVVPVITRPDAYDQNNLGAFELELSAIVILDGDQATGIEIVSGTPIELELSQEYERGTPIAGVGAGAMDLSNAMIAGYHDNYTASNGLQFGSVDLWNSSEKHGLLIGSRYAILDEQFYKEGNLARLLNAISIPEAPHVGVGIDTDTGVHLSDGFRLAGVSGPSIVTILDAQTYHSAQGVQYKGSENTLSLRNVIIDTIAPGDSGYDLQRMRHSLRYPYPQISREFDTLALPSEAGSLIIAGGLDESLQNNPILNRFVSISGGREAKILVIAGGFQTIAAAAQAAIDYSSAINVTTHNLIIPPDSTIPLVIPDGFTGIVFISSDSSKINTDILTPLNDAWMSGTPLLVDDAASAIIGKSIFTESPAISSEDEVLLPKNPPVFQETAQIKEGLNLLEINVTPRIMGANQWANWISLAYNQPELLSLGISENSAVELSRNRAYTLGENPVFVLDLRSATLESGTNNGAVIANGLLDVFAAKEIIMPVTADADAIPASMPTPIVLTPTNTPIPTTTPTLAPTPSPTSTPTLIPTPTKKVKLTPTPLIIPPPSNPGTRNIMVTFGVLIVMVIVIGILLNRRRIF